MFKRPKNTFHVEPRGNDKKTAFDKVLALEGEFPSPGLLEGLGRIWKRQGDFNEQFRSLKGLTMKERVRATKDFLLYIQGELIELAQNLHWKNHRKSNQVFIRSNILVELIDVFKYWNGLALLWGMTPEEFLETWQSKTRVVEQNYKQEFSEPWNPKKYRACVVLDIDDCLADYTNGMRDFIKLKTGLCPHPPKPRQDMASWLGPSIGVEKAIELKHQFREEGHKRNLETVIGAPGFVKRLHQQGCYIVLMTARPYRQYRRIMGDTLEWLAKNEIPYHAIVWDDTKGERIIKDYPQTLFVVEDHTENACKIADKGIPVYVRNVPNNLGLYLNPNCKRFNDYEDLGAMIERRYDL
jgi:hypothetical protein